MKKNIMSMFAAVIFLLSGCLLTASAADKSMNFSEQNGKLYYQSPDQENPEMFIFNQNMQFGEVYTDELTIKNQTKDTYEMYFQMFFPEGQTENALRLLSMVQMRIYLQDKLIYEGTADTMVKTADSSELSQLTSIGTYESGASNDLRVEYYIDADNAVEQNEAYYVKTEYDNWVEGGSIELEKPVAFNTQTEAAAAAASMGSKEIIYLASSHLKDAELEKVTNITASSIWSFYAERNEAGKKDPIKPVSPRPTTGDNNEAAVNIMLVLGMLVVMAVSRRKNQF